LKKNRNVADPVLLIDASNSFVKVGKQNVLQEKDIAKIVDIYMSKQELPGYSHLATRDEVIKNEYNMNIPRYVESVEKEVAQDVDAHLFGGIPSKNVSDLKVLQALVPDILTRNVEEIRPGYIKLMKTVNEISSEVLNNENIITMSNEIEFKTTEYISKYWELLKNVTVDSDLVEIKEGMLSEIKQILSEYQYIDVYGGYQIIAEIWKNALTHDIELIANEGFYNVGRKREPKLVMKGTGTNRREEQDGWIGSIIPNELIADTLFAEQLKNLENKRIKIQDIETELSELVEAAKVDDSEENNALIEAIKKNEEDEPGDAFDNKALKEELKKSKNGSIEYVLLKKVESLINNKIVLTREIKTEEKELDDAVQDKIIILTDEEIDMLMYKKWFGNTMLQMVGLIQVTLKEEVNFLQKLEDRYSYTLSDIDTQIEQLMKDFEMLNNELVVG
jgi:type I restriction enzyme M protein